ncbi:MAG: 2,3-diphosphoglycerate-dependent phosphoglycerate mutase [Bacteroidetes bacterium]|nr:2,3-diphosphoglycerate-dependent phosphoglycerate mutase [Bacteroidota bacterium]MCK4288925.1 2,3-diphosphoglycerate-dependent phosphoglycerate mutase [Bacteroidales bacterium]
MNKLVLLRHGESVWNKANRFTGWTDVGLSEKGVIEAIEAGKVLKEQGLKFKIAYTSYQTRAIKTLWLVLEEMDLMWIPVYKSWRLNEKHYGMLQGLNKIEMAEKYGDKQVLLWRRSYDIPPPPLDKNDKRSPRFDPRYEELSDAQIPLTESLKEVVERMVPYWKNEISKSLLKHKQVLVSAHGNSLRAVVKYLKNMGEEEILKFNIPTGIPYVFEFDDNLNLLKDYFIGDEEEIKILMQQIANQAKK